jgi:flagellar biogenesis protein FliO
MNHNGHKKQASQLPHASRSRAVMTACLWLILALNPTKHSLAQHGLNQETPDRAASNRELLVRRLEALRAAKSESTVQTAIQPAVHTETKEPNELFLDLTESPTAASHTESAQATAATLNVSMTSSPTQVVMRAVAWISIILCVCCLVILAARRWQRERGLLPTTTSRSKVLETLSLGPSRTVSLIEMHGYRALVATDAGGIRSLVLAPSTFEESLREEEVTSDE